MVILNLKENRDCNHFIYLYSRIKSVKEFKEHRAKGQKAS